jgi:hypothetical protein
MPSANGQYVSSAAHSPAEILSATGCARVDQSAWSSKRRCPTPRCAFVQCFARRLASRILLDCCFSDGQCNFINTLWGGNMSAIKIDIEIEVAVQPA